MYIGNWDFAEKLGTSPDLEVARSLMQSEIERYGYRQFVYALIPNLTDGQIIDYVNLNTLDPAWMEEYENEHLYQTDPLAFHCMQGAENNYLWSDYFEDYYSGRVAGWAKRTVTRACDWGLTVGVTMPINQKNSVFAGISLVQDNTVPAKEHDQAFYAHQGRLRELVSVFHAHIDRKTLAQEYFEPSARQIEVLKWLADGKTNKQIAHNMGLAVRTVEDHVAAAAKSLRASTSTQAVAKAIMFDLV